MKKTSKIRPILIAVCAFVLTSAVVAGTLAYLTDTDEAVNTFTVGKVDITLDETAVTTDGEPIPGATRVHGNEYHLIPGQTYTKDPTMTVEATSEESYVRMLVTINCASELQAIFGTGFLPQNYVSGWDPAVWETTGVILADPTANTLTYEFRYFETVDGSDGTLPALFTDFTLPGEIDGDELETIADLEITVEGHAIQAIGFDTAADAWTAFEAQLNS